MPDPITTADLPPPQTEVRQELERARKAAWFLDNSIQLPIIKRRIGVDALLGMIPIIGDLAGLLISLVTIHRAKKFGASFGTLLSMIGNVLVEAIVGLIPFVGDLFDMAWKSNTRNLKLFEQHLTELDTKPQRGFSFRDGLWLTSIVAVIGSMLIGTIVFWLWVFGLI